MRASRALSTQVVLEIEGTYKITDSDCSMRYFLEMEKGFQVSS